MSVWIPIPTRGYTLDPPSKPLLSFPRLSCGVLCPCMISSLGLTLMVLR